jgi:hypothetical protein
MEKIREDSENQIKKNLKKVVKLAAFLTVIENLNIVQGFKSKVAH